MHQTRILALGGQPRSLPVDPYQTDRYLRRTMLFALTAAVLLSVVISTVLQRRGPMAPIPILPERIPPAIITIGPPPAIIQTSGGPLPTRVRIDRGRFIPIPDAEVVETDAPVFETSAGGGDADALTGRGPEGIDALGSFEGWAPPQPQAPTVFLFVEVPPELVSLTIPPYPELAREAGVEGIVHVEVLVGEDGLVRDAVVKQGLPLLNEAALEAASTAVFKPAQQSGQPVRTRVVIPIEFSLRR